MSFKVGFSKIDEAYSTESSNLGVKSLVFSYILWLNWNYINHQPTTGLFHFFMGQSVFFPSEV
jgi:hypothetical protein